MQARELELDMSVRNGSLSGRLGTVETSILELLLEDYKLAARRDHCSRQDFAAGWLALLSRLRTRGVDRSLLRWACPEHPMGALEQSSLEQEMTAA
jgi:hypothetical protein